MTLEQAQERIAELEAAVAQLTDELDRERYPNRPRPVPHEQETPELSLVKRLVRESIQQNSSGLIGAYVWQEADGIVVAFAVSEYTEETSGIFAAKAEENDLGSAVEFRFDWRPQDWWLPHEVHP